MATEDRNAELAGKHALIFDDGLHSQQGHFLGYDCAVARMLGERGARVTVICNAKFQQADALEACGAEVLPIVRRSIWTGDVPAKGAIAELGNHIRQAFHFARLLRRHLANRQYDLAFVPNATLADTMAWWLAGLMRQNSLPGRIALLFRFSTQADPTKPPARKFALWRKIFGLHRKAAGRGKVAFATDSMRLVPEYEVAAGVRLVGMPHPQTVSIRKHATGPRQDGPVTFAMLGHARWDRGVDLFDRAISLLLETDQAQGMHFLLQWHADVMRPDGTLWQPSATVCANPQVTIIREALSPDDYDRMFSKIDCMVLPYRRAIYGSQISGVAVEAACSGIPLICPEGTWLADYSADYAAGITVPSEDVAALAGAIVTVAAGRESFFDRARQAAVRARAQNSAEEFLRVLWTAKSDYVGAP